MGTYKIIVTGQPSSSFNRGVLSLDETMNQLAEEGYKQFVALNDMEFEGGALRSDSTPVLLLSNGSHYVAVMPSLSSAKSETLKKIDYLVYTVNLERKSR